MSNKAFKIVEADWLKAGEEYAAATEAVKAYAVTFGNGKDLWSDAKYCDLVIEKRKANAVETRLYNLMIDLVEFSD